ncbi:hypothetical protein [Luteolibacter luteus]|uniref:Uncharacterized protein n=1 Tax=Luteolibacter luteus TaxID=2728835 RepID=A0A858RQQ6_9BACT|nr:hypothetical protein [Luteolibacter luteus]QJE98864.1 hypothetical protein HHL09_24820 [Luteolibacter luteus]
MKPESATLYAVSGLLLLSALCVGGRIYVDEKGGAAALPPAKPAKALGDPAPEVARGALPKPMARPGDSSPLVSQLRAILALGTTIDRTKALLALTAGFKDPEDWRRALTALDELGVRRGFSGWDVIMYAWAESDPLTAMTYSIENKVGTDYVMEIWLSVDPDGALAYLESPEGKQEIQIWRNLVGSTMNRLGGDLPRLERLLKAIPENERRMVAPYLKTKFTAPYETLKPWVGSLDPWLKEAVVRMLMQGLPDMQQKLVVAADFPEQVGAQGQSMIYAAWMKENEAEAMAAFDAMEEGPSHKAALGAAMMHYYRSARLAEALELYKKWPEEVGQPFLSDLLLCERVEDAEVILASIPLHQSESLRLNRYRVALEMWFSKEPDAVRKWLAENEVPEIVRKEWDGK